MFSNANDERARTHAPQQARGDADDPSSAEPGPAAGRGDMIGLALQIDEMVARSQTMGLGLVAYLLGVARAELGERLGERQSSSRGRTSAPEFRDDRIDGSASD